MLIDEKADSTAETNQDEEIVNDLDTLPIEGDESVEGEEGAADVEVEPDEKDVKILKLEKQIRTSDRKYEKATRDMNKLRGIQRENTGDKATLTDDEKKDKQAKDFIRKEAREERQEAEKARQEEEETAIETLEEELQDVLLENENLTEDEILTFMEDMAKKDIKLSPTQAANLIKEGFGKKEVPAKPKPKLPISNRGSGKVDLKPEKSEETKGMSYQEKIAAITRRGKEALLKKQ